MLHHKYRISKKTIFEKIDSYKPCCKCNKPLPKNIPIINLNIMNRKRKCQCGKVHIDDVMIDVFKITSEFGEYDYKKDITLKNVGVPLIEVGYPLNHLPVIGDNELIIMANISKKCASSLVDDIDEIKGVIGLNNNYNDKIVGDMNYSSLGINELIAGDDFRCDVFPLRLLNDYIISCKNQSRVHIEFPRPFNPKIYKVERLNLKDKIVIDGFCGVGTLGMIALKKGAKKVIFCDINNYALNNLEYNLRLNFNDNIFERVEIHNCNFLDLDLNTKGDLCLIDVFPQMDVSIFLKKAKNIANKVVII